MFFRFQLGLVVVHFAAFLLAGAGSLSFFRAKPCIWPPICNIFKLQ